MYKIPTFCVYVSCFWNVFAAVHLYLTNIQYSHLQCRKFLSPPESLHPNVFSDYILGVQFNFYQNITEICIVFSNKVLGTAIYFLSDAKHLPKICQLEQKLK